MVAKRPQWGIETGGLVCYNFQPMFRKIDFHVHTPASSCYLDHIDTSRGPTYARDIIAAARAMGLEAIVITDHNTAQGIEAVRKAAADTGMVVFPGMEISARGGHILAMFDPSTPIERMHRLVGELKLRKEQMGQGYEEVPMLIDEAFEVIAQAGGLAIAAHIDRRPRGFAVSEELKREEKQRIYSSPALSALEITVPFDKLSWNKGLMPGYPLGKACIQGSDAHAPEEMGRRPVYMDVAQLDLEGVRAAFQEPESHIRFPSEVLATT